MGLLRQLENNGINIDEIENLSAQELIRIEKRLKVEARMNNEIDINEVEIILDALKNHKDELRTLFGKEFSRLRRIIENVKTPYAFKKPFSGTITDIPGGQEKFTEFLHTQFGKELGLYVESCFKKDHYNAIHSLLFYREILPVEITENIAHKLSQKLTYSTECISIKSENLEKRILAVLNPYFFRSLSLIGSVRFESDVNHLLNVTIDALKSRKLKFRLLYAMGSFTALGEELKNVIDQNKEVASGQGARELNYDFQEKKGKGGTYINRSVVSSGSSRSSKGGAFGGIGVVAFIIYLIIKVAVISNRNSTPDYNFELPEYFKNINTIQYGEEDAGYDFVEEMNYLHNEAVILNQRAIPFEIDCTGFNQPHPLILGSKNVELDNKTDQRLVTLVISENWEKFFFLEPQESIKIPSTSQYLRFYTGDEPEIVRYIQADGDTTSCFWFNQFDEANHTQLQESYPLNHLFMSNHDYQITILQNHSGEKVEIQVIEIYPE